MHGGIEGHQKSTEKIWASTDRVPLEGAESGDETPLTRQFYVGKLVGVTDLSDPDALVPVTLDTPPRGVSLGEDLFNVRKSTPESTPQSASILGDAARNEDIFSIDVASPEQVKKWKWDVWLSMLQEIDDAAVILNKGSKGLARCYNPKTDKVEVFTLGEAMAFLHGMGYIVKDKLRQPQTTETVPVNQPVAHKETQGAGSMEEYRRIEARRQEEIRKKQHIADLYMRRLGESNKDIKKAPTQAAAQERFFDPYYEGSDPWFDSFGISIEDLESIEGYTQLSEGQQQLVFRNLGEYKKSIEGGFLSDVWNGFMSRVSVFSESSSDKTRRNTDTFIAAAAKLVSHIQANGPKKFHKEEGSTELLPDLVGIEYDRENRKQEWEAVKNVNSIAHKLAKTPASWQEDGIGTHATNQSKIFSFFKDAFSGKREQYNKYQELQKSYEDAKSELASVLQKAGVSAGEIAGRLIEIDGRVSGLQFMQTSPDAVATIEKIPDTSTWKSIGKSLTDKSNLGWMAAGFGIRAAATSLGFMNLAVAPVVSAALAGTRAWNKTAAELRERDRAARAGVASELGYEADKEASGVALNIIQASQIVEQNGIQKENGATQKLQALIERYQLLDNKPGNIEERNKVFEQLQSRAQYMLDKQKLNRISFGTADVRPMNMAKFFETLAQAHVIIADNKRSEKSRTSKRMDQYLAYRENAIQDRRRILQSKKFTWHALRAGTLATAGALLADYVQSLRSAVSPVDASRAVAGKVSEFRTPDVRVAPEVPSAQAIDRAAGIVADAVPQTFEPYTVQSGDTLTRIVEKQLGGQGNVMKVLKSLTPNEIRGLGLRSENIDKIYPDEKIDIGKLKAIFESRK